MAEYLVFKLSHRVFAIEASQVLEIVALGPITRVPRAGDHVLGVTNLRGRVVPVVDLAKRLSLPPDPDAQRRSIVVLRLASKTTGFSLVGIRVDAVSDVIDLAGGDIEDTPALGESDVPEGIAGLARRNGEAVLLLRPAELILRREPGELAGGLSHRSPQLS